MTKPLSVKEAATGDPLAILREYPGDHMRDALGKFALEAVEMEGLGYLPVSTNWARGQWGWGALAFAAVTSIIGIGVLIWAACVLIPPEGSLLVVYHRSNMLGSTMRAATPGDGEPSPLHRPRGAHDG